MNRVSILITNQFAVSHFRLNTAKEAGVRLNMTGLRSNEYAESGFGWVFPVRFWFACGIFKARREADESQTDMNYAGGYSRPPLWKRLLRKLKAESKHVHVACCHWCPHETISHQYTALSYQKNFDQGHSHHHSLQVFARNASLVRENTNTSTDSEDFWKDVQYSMTEHGSRTATPIYLPEGDSTPLWQRDRSDPTKKKVCFAE